MVDLNKKVLRHNTKERLSHWLVVFCFFTTGLSGLSFFFQDFSWIADILGTPQLARIVHPFTGLIMIAAFMVLFKTISAFFGIFNLWKLTEQSDHLASGIDSFLEKKKKSGQ